MLKTLNKHQMAGLLGVFNRCVPAKHKDELNTPVQVERFLEIL